jgi:redox-sensitive bicupin YhaK (pirin superfamily)
MQATLPSQPRAKAASAHDRVRHVVFRTNGRTHGPITRLASPSDVGELIKPFVFLDHCVIESSRQPGFNMHPHSGIATITVPLSGAIEYEDTTGKKGVLSAGGIEWMKAGNGVWHDGSVLPGDVARVFQLWIALPASQENSPAESQYVAPSDVRQEGPVRVILGSYGNAASTVRSPEGIHYYHVQLEDGESWRHEPPAGYSVAWLAVDQGQLYAPEPVEAGQLAVFSESDGDAVEVQAHGRVSFVFGTAIKHPHPLMLGSYSVHTSREALERGEAEIGRIGKHLRAIGRI